MSSLSTHVLDAVLGEPAVGMQVQLFGSGGSDGAPIGDGRTNSDGRIPGLAPAQLEPGLYRLVFATGDYFSSRAGTCFYPEVVIAFEVDEDRHYHVPLLLSPFAYTTYRGS